MALPNKLTEDELARYGFARITETQAKHIRYVSYRHKCVGCEFWCKQLINDLCNKCLRKYLRGDIDSGGREVHREKMP